MAHKQITTQKETLRDGEQQKRYSATEHDGYKHNWNTIKIIALLRFVLSGEQLNHFTYLLDISLSRRTCVRVFVCFWGYK